MKFGKLLKDLTEGNPQMSEQPLIRYKELKKHLKSIKKRQAGPAQAVADSDPQQQEQEQEQEQQQALPSQEQLAALMQPAEDVALPPLPDLPPGLSVEEQAFINMLNEDLTRFNRFFMDKEEEAVIKLQALADRIGASQGSGPVEVQDLKAALVDFHGEMVLLLHWSLLNYAAVVKILKKHDKSSGLLLRAPYLANVLQQPFYSTSIMSRLVKMAEGHIESLVAQEAQHGTADAAAPAVAAVGEDSSARPAAAAPGQQAAGEAAGGLSHSQPAAAADEAGQGVAAAAAAPDNGLQGAAAPGAAAAGTAAGAAAGHEGESDTDTEELLASTAVCARTRVALQTWQQLCSNASTPSTVLPPHSSQALVRALQVRQRWAKLTSMAPIMQQAGMEAPLPGGAAAEGVGEVDTAVAAAGVVQQQQQQQGAQAAAAGARGEEPSGRKHKDEADTQLDSAAPDATKQRTDT